MNRIDQIIEELQDKCGCAVFFDDSRLWTLGFKKDNEYYGAQRAYLGGGVRGSIRTRAPEDEPELAEAFKQGLLDIEAAINEDTEGLESWEQNTGVLL